MEQKTSIKVSCTNVIYNGENIFLQLLLVKVYESFLFKQSKNICEIRWSGRVFLAYIEKRRPNKYNNSGKKFDNNKYCQKLPHFLVMAK